ncbi:MAG: hypothetical protein ACJ8CZ_16520, partial [Microvirga sp.]
KISEAGSIVDVPKVAGESKAVRTFGPEYAPSLFSGLVSCIDALWIRPGSGELKHRLADAESRLADAENRNAHLQTPADSTAPSSTIWMLASPTWSLA